jgi:putative ABC transport system ATP-binding protein
MLLVEALGHDYAGRSVLDVARWDVPGGARRAVAGPSGSGKTTLLAILAGLIRPGRGSVRVGDIEVSSLSPAALDRWRAGNVGLVMQTPHLLGPLDASENVTAAQYLAGEKPDPQRAAGLLGQLGLAARTHAKPHELSRGEQQRVAIARAVINKPKLLLADEPTANLDDASCEAVLDLFERAAGDAIFIVATHDARVKARYAERLELGGRR